MASKSSCFELKSYNVRLLGGRELHFFLHKSVKLIVIRLKGCLLHSWERIHLLWLLGLLLLHHDFLLVIDWQVTSHFRRWGRRSSPSRRSGHGATRSIVVVLVEIRLWPVPHGWLLM